MPITVPKKALIINQACKAAAVLGSTASSALPARCSPPPRPASIKATTAMATAIFIATLGMACMMRMGASRRARAGGRWPSRP
jgi:hypothetical protein